MIQVWIMGPVLTVYVHYVLQLRIQQQYERGWMNLASEKVYESF